MSESTDLERALNRLSKLANEEASGDDIPTHFITKIDSSSPKKSSQPFSAYFRNENFSKDKSLKIGNQKRLKFLEELSELRDKPNINSSFNTKVTLMQSNTPIYLRAAQIIKDRNLSISMKKVENSRKMLAEEGSGKKNSSQSPGRMGQEGFLESVRIWQMKKEKNIKKQQELKEQNEARDLKFSPTLNEKSMKIMKKLKEIQHISPEIASLASIFKKNDGSCSARNGFHPAITTKSRKLTLHRTTSVFERLYTPKTQPKQSPTTKSPKPKPKSQSPLSHIDKPYSINSGRGIISNKSLIDEIIFSPSMKFLLGDHLK